MLKTWFPYNLGFVNIDSENLYLTNTGNWSETKGLQEKGIGKTNAKRRFRIGAFIAIVALASVILFLTNLLGGKLSLLILVGLPMAGLAVYKYMKTELGAAYSIPLIKIQRIEINDKQVTLYFVDGLGQADIETLNEVDEKGLAILTTLKDK
jgi:hypothetical protein